MLACVCRPVNSGLPKPPGTMAPQSRTSAVVTCEPRAKGKSSKGCGSGNGGSSANASATSGSSAAATAPSSASSSKVPGRPTAAELRVMALRQQQQISTQHQLLAAKEQRLRFLKSQDARGAAQAAEGERLRRLRERVEAQESKLRRLRALRGQVDLQKSYNVTLSSDLDSIRALFSEKEKELSLAVAKVEALTRQLEDLRKDRRGPLNLITGLATGNGGTGQKSGNSGGSGANGGAGNNNVTSPTTKELEKLRRELMYRNQLSLQQDARLHLQREALQQRQSELRSVDLRILELQNRLQRKKASNLLLAQAQNQNNLLEQQQHLQANGFALKSRPSNNVYPTQRSLMTGPQQHLLGNNVAAVEPFIHQPQKQISPPLPLTKSKSQFITRNKSLQQQQLLSHSIQQHQQQQLQQQQQQVLIQNHVQTKTTVTVGHESGLKGRGGSATNTSSAGVTSDCDDNKLKQLLVEDKASNRSTAMQQDSLEEDELDVDEDGNSSGSSEFSLKKNDPKYQTLPYNTKFNGLSTSKSSPNVLQLANGTTFSSPPLSTPKTTTPTTITTSNASPAASAIPLTVAPPALKKKANECDSEKIKETKNNNQHQQQPQQIRQPGHATKSGIQKPSRLSLSPGDKLKSPGQHTTMAVPPRKPISSVAPTTVSNTPTQTQTMIPKIVPKMVQMVAPNNTSNIPVVDANSSPRPALPPKPNNGNGASSSSPQSSDTEAVPAKVARGSSLLAPALVQKSKSNNSIPTIVSVINKQSAKQQQQTITTTVSEEVKREEEGISVGVSMEPHLPIKAKPLTIKKQPLHEQPKLKASAGASAAAAGSGIAVSASMKPYLSRRIEMPPSFLFPEIETAELKPPSEDGPQGMTKSGPAKDETDRMIPTNNEEVSSNSSSLHNKSSSISSMSSANSDKNEVVKESVARRSRLSNGTSLSGGNGQKVKLARRVSFDPLALLLDASLEGELELVRKTATQVPNPSAANDEGITALHNAICAGHLEIVKFLVEFGCDVNAQDSDGWTPLHCAASCNNLAMVKFLVESGACLFAATLSDHETPAEKCEEDEEGFDGCSEYLYNIQEKLGIMNTGEVYSVFSYEAQHNDELTFMINDPLTILRKGDDAEREWWWARNQINQEGYVPRNLLGLFPRIYRQQMLADSD